MDRLIQCYVDRFEGDSAVLLIEGMEAVISASILPPEVREGDHLQISLSIDAQARDRTAAEISELQRKLQPGNIDE